jgi:hypothetical protein
MHGASVDFVMGSGGSHDLLSHILEESNGCQGNYCTVSLLEMFKLAANPKVKRMMRNINNYGEGGKGGADKP